MSQPSSWLITEENVERGTTWRPDLLHTEHRGQDPAYGLQNFIKSNSFLETRLSSWFLLQCRAAKNQTQIKTSFYNIVKVDIAFSTEIAWEPRCGLALQPQNRSDSVPDLTSYYQIIKLVQHLSWHPMNVCSFFCDKQITFFSFGFCSLWS